MITKEQVQVVLDNLEKVLPMAARNKQLDMRESHVNCNDHECGTVHCLGGWYAIATLDTNKDLDYMDGADSLANDLGFNDHIDLEQYLYKSFKSWGNSRGDLLFQSKFAFESELRPNGARNLKDIYDHFKEFQNRI